MKNVLKKPLSVIMAVIVCCYTMVFAFASSNAASDIIGYYSGVENTYANVQISGITGADDEIFVNAYYSPCASRFIVGLGHTSYVLSNEYCFTMPEVRICLYDGTMGGGYFQNCVLNGSIIRENSFFNTDIYLCESGYKYKQV